MYYSCRDLKARMVQKLTGESNLMEFLGFQSSCVIWIRFVLHFIAGYLSDGRLTLCINIFMCQNKHIRNVSHIWVFKSWSCITLFFFNLNLIIFGFRFLTCTKDQSVKKNLHIIMFTGHAFPQSVKEFVIVICNSTIKDYILTGTFWNIACWEDIGTHHTTWVGGVSIWLD